MYQPLLIPTLCFRHRFLLEALVAAACCSAGLLACEDRREPTTPEGPASAVGAAATEAPAPPEEAGASGPGVQAITLPVAQSIATTAPDPAFRITQTGTGPNGIFRIDETTSEASALLARTNGRAPAFRALTEGTRYAARVEVDNLFNFAGALLAETNGQGGSAILGRKTTNGGSAGRFEFASVDGSGFALIAEHEGIAGPAARFSINNPNNSGLAVWATTDGAGSAGRFDDLHPSSLAPALFARTLSARGAAGSFLIENATSTGPAIVAATDGTGEAGRFVNRSSTGAGVVIDTRGGLGLEVGVAHSASSIFNGDVTVNGTLTKSAGSFKIDHPLDPAHKYLSHSFVESPDMLNVYNGNATLDGRGEAVVLLPAYFEALNRDFRYQLTPIDAPGPNLYIAEEISGNRFVIAGGTAGARVSWQVTGVRQDAYAEAHRIQVEQDKGTGLLDHETTNGRVTPDAAAAPGP
jgi:hypothetical protein